MYHLCALGRLQREFPQTYAVILIDTYGTARYVMNLHNVCTFFDWFCFLSNGLPVTKEGVESAVDKIFAGMNTAGMK